MFGMHVDMFLQPEMASPGVISFNINEDIQQERLWLKTNN